jgi:glycosyltransferase involved in cell wall biosynthesis
MRLAGYILTKDSAPTIQASVSSLQDLAEVVLVVDSGSVDDTIAIATAAGAVAVYHPFDSFPSQRNWAVSELLRRCAPEWIFALDSDEWLSSDLRDLLSSFLCGPAESRHDIVEVRRLVRFDGRLLRWGGYGEIYIPRLFRPDYARYEDRPVNEQLVVPRSARVTRFRAPIIHSDVADWSQYIQKHDSYSTSEACVRVGREKSQRRSPPGVRRHLRRRVREDVWERLPLRPVLRFLYSYIIRLGFLDRRSGLERAIFDSWHEMCIDLKSDELRRGQSSP